MLHSHVSGEVSFAERFKVTQNALELRFLQTLVQCMVPQRSLVCVGLPAGPAAEPAG